MKFLIFLSISIMLPALSFAKSKNKWNFYPNYYRIVEGSSEDNTNYLTSHQAKQPRIVPWEELKKNKHAVSVSDAYNILWTAKFDANHTKRSTALTDIRFSQVDEPELMWELAQMLADQTLSNSSRSTIIYTLAERQVADPGIHIILAEHLNHPDLKYASAHAFERIQSSCSPDHKIEFSPVVMDKLSKAMFVDSGIQDQIARVLERTGRSQYEVLEYMMFCDDDSECDPAPNTLSHRQKEFAQVDEVSEHKAYMADKVHSTDIVRSRIMDHFGDH